MMSMQKKGSGSGFTLVETLVAVLVLSFMLVAVTSLLTRILNATQIAQDRYLATKLAQEGMALIKAKRNIHMRDDPANWTTNLVNAAGEVWEPDSTQTARLVPNAFFDVGDPSAPRTLCIRTGPANEKGQYWYDCDPGNPDAAPLPGNFTRQVEVRYGDGDEGYYSVSVTCTVTWNNGADQLVVSTMLFKVT